ncbi:MAG: 5'-nucleotidase C-terminal domain-containing protein [Chitinophagales bacterium]
MRLVKLSGLLLVLFVAACNKHFQASQYKFEEKKIDATVNADEKLKAIIQPFKDSLDKEMNVVIGYSDTILTRNQPESDLGNFMCDMLLQKANVYYGKQVDFTFLNNGGIRIPNLAAGPVTIGKIIELIPFDNRLVVMQLKGSTVDSLFNYIASKGGWNISGARYKIKEGKAIDITIRNTPLDKNVMYTMAVSDYLAQGGDNCTMLKGIPYIDLKRILRDILIEGIKEKNARGEHIRSVLDGRIQIANP